MCCDACRQDQIDFNKLTPRPESHLSEEDQRAVERYKRLKKFTYVCLTERGTGIDWEWLCFAGKLSDYDLELFGLDKMPGMDVINYEI